MIDQDLIEAVRVGMVAQQVKDRLLNEQYSEPYVLSTLLAQVLHGNATIAFIRRNFDSDGSSSADDETLTPHYDIRITGQPQPNTIHPSNL